VRASEHTPVDVAVADADDDRDTEGARDGVILVEGLRESVTSVVEVRDVLRLALTDRESVGSVDPLADTLLETVVDAVSEAVKLGDTGDFVRDGVGVGEGMIAVYDMKNTDPEPRLIILAPIWPPPEL
jgi:hypothetical protein